MLVGAGAHLVGTAEAQPQLSQDLQHAQAAVALDSVKGPDSRQALPKAEVLPHYRTQVGHEEGSDLTLHNKMGECETPPSPRLVHAIPGLPRYLPPNLAVATKLPALSSLGLPKSTGQKANSPAWHSRICDPAPPPPLPAAQTPAAD